MHSSFLNGFPREIRDLVYTFVLASPSGTITLTPWTIQVARSLSLLRTCHQIRRECKEIIWAHTGLRIKSPTQLQKGLEELVRLARVQHLRISMELLDRDELEWIIKSAHPLRGICRAGILETITLSASWEKPRGLEEFKEILNLRKYGGHVDGRLLLGTQTSDTLFLNTGWPTFTHWGKQRWLREMLLDSEGTERLLKALHDMLGGSLFVNGTLCYQHTQRIRDPVLDPRDGEIQIVIDGSNANHENVPKGREIA